MFAQARKIVENLPRKAHVIAKKTADNDRIMAEILETPEQIAEAESASLKRVLRLPSSNVMSFKFPKYGWPTNKKKTELELRNTYLLYKPLGATSVAGAFDLREVLQVEHDTENERVVLTFKKNQGSKRAGPVEISCGDHPEQVPAWYSMLSTRWDYIWTTLSEAAQRWSPSS